MAYHNRIWILAFLASWNLSTLAHSQEEAIAEPLDERTTEQVGSSYYPGPKIAPKKSIPQQKAELRAQQRMARLAAQRWYGFSNARPTVAAIPFTSMYRPAWQQPGGWPYRWQRPVVVIVR